MNIKLLPVEVTQSEKEAGVVVTRRAQEILGYMHPDSVRKDEALERAGRGLWNLESVMRRAAERKRATTG